MDKVKRFFDCYIPITTCNLRCSYCYVAQQGLFKAQPPKFEHSAAEIRRALSVKRCGGKCIINLCAGGETLIAHEVVDIIHELLAEGHYVMVVTNGLLTERFEEISKFEPALLKHLFFKFSFHYLELKRLNAFDSYFANVNRMKKAGCSFTVELTPCDEEIPLIPEIKQTCMKYMGVLCHVTVGRDENDPYHRLPHLSKLDWEDYIKTWSVFDSALFDFKTSIFYKPRKEYCYAGVWSAQIHLGNGALTQCYCGRVLQNIFENPDEPLRTEPIGHHCTMAHCTNGHAFLTLGVIPELPTVTFAEVRNRTFADGTEWLQPEVKAMFSSHLEESNREFTPAEKTIKEIKHSAVKLLKREH